MKVRFIFNRYLLLALAVFAACALESCATYSKVSERPPHFTPFASGGPLANAATEIVTAMRIDRRDPLVALGEYLSAAQTALGQLDRSPNDQAARNTYNFAVGPHHSHHPRCEARSVDTAAASAGERRGVCAHT